MHMLHGPAAVDREPAVTNLPARSVPT